MKTLIKFFTTSLLIIILFSQIVVDTTKKDTIIITNPLLDTKAKSINSWTVIKDKFL